MRPGAGSAGECCDSVFQVVAPSIGELPELLLQIVASGIATALLYTALSMAVSSFTTRRAAAAVATVLLLFVPTTVVRSAIDSTGAPDELGNNGLELALVRDEVVGVKRSAWL